MGLEELTRKMSKYYETNQKDIDYNPNKAKIPTFNTPTPIPYAGSQSNNPPSVSKQTGSGANAVGMASANLGAGVAKKQTIPVSQRQFGIGMQQTKAQPQKLPYAGKVSASLPQYNAVTPSGGSKVPALPYYQAPGISSDTWKKQAEQLKEDVAQQQKTVRPWQNTSGTMQTASYMKTPQAFQKDGRAMSIEKPESVVRNEQKLDDLKSSLANAQNHGYMTDYSEQWRAIESRDDAEDVKAKLARMASMKNNIGTDMGQNIASMNEYQRLRGELESKGINAEGVADWLRRNSNVMEAYYQQQRDIARATKTPIISPIVESLKTVPQSLYGGTGALAGVTQSAMNSRTGEYRPIDTMGDAFDIARARQTVRGTVGDNFGQWVYEKTGNQNIANAANFLYGTAMSGLDSAFIAALGGGATAAIGATGGTAAINGAASIILGSNAASETMMDVVNRGGSTDQAVASGLLAGAAETIFEKVSIDGLISKFKSGERGFRAFIKNATLQGASEASEEMATEIANVIADYYVNGGLSEIEQMRQSGMSDVEIANEIAKRVGVAGAGGFLMGFVGGGVANLTGGISKGGKNSTAAEYAGLYGSYKNSVSTDTSPVESVSEQGQQVTPTAAENTQGGAVQAGSAPLSLARQYAGQNISNSQATEILNDPESIKEMTDAGVNLSGTSSQRRKAVKDYVQGIGATIDSEIEAAREELKQAQFKYDYAEGNSVYTAAERLRIAEARVAELEKIKSTIEKISLVNDTQDGYNNTWKSLNDLDIETASWEEINNSPEIIDARKRADSGPPTNENNSPERKALRNRVQDSLYAMGSFTRKVGDEEIFDGPVKQERKAYIVIGPPAAGKSSVFANPLSKENSARIIDSDMAKKLLPEFDEGFGASRVHEESSDIANRLFAQAVANGDNIVYPLVGKNADKIRTIKDDLKEKRYTVELYLNELPAEKAARRAVRRFMKENRLVDSNYVLSVGNKPSRTYDILREEGGFDRYVRKSNDVAYGQQPILVEDYTPGEELLRLVGERGRATGQTSRTAEKQSIRNQVTDTKPGSGFSMPETQRVPYAPGFNPDSQAAPQQLPRAEQTQPQQLPYAPGYNAANSPVQPTLPRAEELNAERQKNAHEPNFPSYGANTVGSAQVNPESYAHLQNEYGVVSPGENPARVIDMPVKDAQGQTNSLFARTIAESESMPNEMVPEWEQAVASGEFSHDIATDKAATRHAERELGKGWDYAMRQWQAVSEGDKIATKNDLALAQLLLANAMKDGDTQTAMKLAAELCAEATRAGQNVQAFQLLKKMTPEGMLYYLQKTVNNLNSDFEGRKGFEGIKIDEGMAERLGKATTREEMNAIVDEIRQDIADQTPINIWDRINSWRYFAMLFNPTTHIRNVAGNAVFYPIVSAKNKIATGIEAYWKKNGRLPEATKATLGKADKPLLDFAKADYENVVGEIQGEGKYSDKDSIMRMRRPLGNGILGKLNDVNTELLDKEDKLFSRARYRQSLASYMKANNITVEQARANQNLLNKARAYAIKEAQKGTYRDNSAVANYLNQTKRKLEKAATNKNNKGIIRAGARVGEMALDGVLPFTKTPINIVKRGVEYSPAGLLRGAANMAFNVKNGKVSANEAIDQFAAGCTGTMVVALGALLSSLGALTGGSDEDDKLDKFAKMLGEKNYAFNPGAILRFFGIDAPDTYYTIDWMAPVALPLFVGVEAQKSFAEENIDLADWLSALSSIADPIVELSMLSSLDDALSSVKYGNSAPSAITANLLSSYAGQLVPTVGGKFERTFDGTSRQTYYDPNLSTLEKTADVIRQKAQAKIPYFGSKLQPRVDMWGREQKNVGGNGLGRFAYNMLSPGYYSTENVTDVDKELQQLYDATGERLVLPSYAAKTFSMPGDAEDVKLNAKEYTQYAKDKGSKAYDIFDDLIDYKSYQSMSNDEKVEVAKNVYEYANAVAKSNVSDYQLREKAAKIQECEKAGIPAGVAIVAYVAQKNVEGDKDSKGNTIPLSASKNKKAAIDRMTPFISQSQRELLYELFGVSGKVW